MSKKIEKLKEVNNALKNILIVLETRMFIENIIDVDDKSINMNVTKPKIVTVPKQ